MKVLITGGCGYIGCSLVQKLEDNNKIESIIILDDLSNTNNNFFFGGKKFNKVHFIKGNILDSIILEELVEKVDAIIHLAAQVTFPFAYNDHHKYEQVNQYGSLQLYQILKKYKSKKIIYLSSAAIYGFQDIANEETAANPENAYGISKYNGEKYIQLLKEHSDVYILRSANVFGFNSCIRTDAVINKFILDAVMYNKLVIYGNGKQTRPFIYIETLITEIESFLMEKYKPGIFNLVEENLSLEDLRDILIENISGLEFTYASASSKFPSTTMNSNKIFLENKLKDNIVKTLNAVKKQYRL